MSMTAAAAIAAMALDHGIRPAWSPDSGFVLGTVRKTYLYDDSASATLTHNLRAATASGVNEPIATNGVSDNWIRAFTAKDNPSVYGLIDSVQVVFHDQPMAELEDFELWSVAWRSGYLEIDDGESNEKIPIEKACGFPHKTAVSNGTAAIVSYGTKVAPDVPLEGGSRFVDFEEFTHVRGVWDAANNTLGADSDVSYYLTGLFVRKSVPGAKELRKDFDRCKGGKVDQAFLDRAATATTARIARTVGK